MSAPIFPLTPAQKPPFIVLEGLDGAGTTTQSSRLLSRLLSEGQPAMVTREPSDGPIGTLIRQMLSMRVVLPKADGSVGPIGRETLALLFAADRLDHIEAEIKPALAGGRIVISDRYVASSLVYQGDVDEISDMSADSSHETSEKMDFRWVKTINERAIAPDMIFYLQASAELCMSRLDRRARRDIYETRQKLERLERRYEEVMTMLEAEGTQKIIRLDASASIDTLHAQIYEHVRAYCERSTPR